MKNVLLSTCLAISLILTACGNKRAAVIEPETTANRESAVIAATEAESRGETTETIPEIQETGLGMEPTETLLTINISVGGRVFPAKLYDNAATRELMARMPLELDMSELHGNEKYYYLPEVLPTDSENPGSIHTGDLMLYGSDCLVLFYEDFQSSFSYTRLGYLEDPAGLSEAAGADSVTVTFETAE
ncbi:cyclophilin-like fold protein [Clostridium transplantifaecale]|uniref:cyclophilin-like fold protein n=1 Tax=Clostridium transplantifaecale TaxID=2479838 RepID=UPI001FA9D998|nr:cyclophilin-like fold protein [Clostridium transplantifaecale]